MLLFIALLGCPAAPDPKADAATGTQIGPDGKPIPAKPEAVIPMPVSPPLLGLHVVSAEGTSGTGADEVLDDNLRTGWRPQGTTTGARLLIRFESPVTADAVLLEPCPASPSAQVALEINGAPVGNLTANGAGLGMALGPDGAGWRVQTLLIDITSGQPGLCVGELRLTHRDQLLPLRKPRSVAASIRASSVLPPAAAHHPNLLFDHRLNFGWVEGKAAAGLGESVEIAVSSPFGLVALDLWNGDQGSPERFADRPRARGLAVAVDGGARVTLPVADTLGPQRLSLPRMLVGRSFVFSVTDLQPGGRSTDLTLSELVLVDPLGPVQLRVQAADDRRGAVLPPLRHTALGQVLDRHLTDLCSAQTLQVRSDLGFQATGPGGRTEGEWTASVTKTAWLDLQLWGDQQPIAPGWVAPEAMFAAGPIPEGGKVAVVGVEALGRADFVTQMAGWKGNQRAVAECVVNAAKGEGMEPFDLLVKRGAIITTGALGLRIFAE